MKKTSDQNPRSGPGRTGDTTQPSKETAPKEVIKKKEDVQPPPLHAAKGNDEVMSQPPSRSQP